MFSRDGERDSLQRIYVINLDRRPDRWQRVCDELDRFSDRHGARLSTLTRRFSAIDARYMDEAPDPEVLIPKYTLADQLTVDPNPLLRIDTENRAREIQMTPQEIAIALSHVDVWKLIADGDTPSALVLEDDVYMEFGFAGEFARTWQSLDREQEGQGFDLLYLAFEEVGEIPRVEPGKSLRRLDGPGIWEASGYILTREGANKLLDQLPVFGPIDLWLNFQFKRLNAFTSAKPIIAQRIDEPSTNSYSVLPVLSQVGVITREKPLLPTSKHLPGPVVAVGNPGSGLTALATALSMIGYTCLSDIDRMPTAEEEALNAGRRSCTFNAYVNVGSHEAETLAQIASANPSALFISTSLSTSLPGIDPRRILRLAPKVKDKWEALTEFLKVEYPALPYPVTSDIEMRSLDESVSTLRARRAIDLVADSGPWILSGKPASQHGIRVKPTNIKQTDMPPVNWVAGKPFDKQLWALRSDTFPSNLAMFSPDNVTVIDDETLLTLRQEQTPVREFTSGAIASVASYRYGRFRASLRPSGVQGLVTGMFLHRNGPHQEIDIEFLGEDTTKMLINVFYNPGPAGTKLEYGYRGTPTLIDLGFDAAEDFHDYEINWQPGIIQWSVDGEVIYERTIWNPTPIPDQSLQFNFNLWHSRSKELAGRLNVASLPATASIRSIEIQGVRQNDTSKSMRMGI
ncbi:family 16 glycosylhydrolase [Corynebacterium sp. S7]